MYTKSIVIKSIFFILITARLQAGLLINEIACNTPGDDWVELFLSGSPKDTMEISGLFVTMYYGTNEHLSESPVTIYACDRPETQYDDRFVVVHLTEANTEDETDLTGDTNKNGRIDIYCNNYSGSLWNTDCVVAVDTDDDPENGGILDFAAYSNRDGSPNDVIQSYIDTASSFGQWNTAQGNIQECMIYTGPEGLGSFMTIARISAADTNSLKDFTVTRYMTPGKENMLNDSVSESGNIFKTIRKKISVTPEHFTKGNCEIRLFIYRNCNVRLRIFSSIGLLVYESPLYKDIFPGNYTINWNLKGSGKKACTGLYIAQIEATKKEIKKTQTEKVYMIVKRHR